MKKIMFNDRYGLTKAVLDGRKTMTRRIIKFSKSYFYDAYVKNFPIICKIVEKRIIDARSSYKLDEIVAVSQSYKDSGIKPEYIVGYENNGAPITAIQSPGWNNKMFTRADLMPHQIRITDIRVERLQGISDDDCLREGIRYIKDINKYYFERTDRDEGFCFENPRSAFASLIDKVSGRGTWDENPYVFVYQFELVK